MPFGIATDAAGNVYVSDFTNNRIQKFDSSGIHLLSFGSQGIVDGTFQFPRDLTVDASGNIWVADTNNNRVQNLTAPAIIFCHWAVTAVSVGQISESQCHKSIFYHPYDELRG